MLSLIFSVIRFENQQLVAHTSQYPDLRSHSSNSGPSQMGIIGGEMFFLDIVKVLDNYLSDCFHQLRGSFLIQ